MKDRYDIKAEQGGYHPGDRVWLYNPRRVRGHSPKLQTSWEGPFEVVTRINDVVYRIRKPPKGKPRVVHFNRLAPFHGDNGLNKDQEARGCLLTKETFEEFMANLESPQEYKVTTERNQDLFTLPKDFALAHCVTKNLGESRGIATVFRKKFGGLNELYRQKPAIGKTLHLQKEEQHLFYLVTKEEAQQKSTYKALWESLIHLRDSLSQMKIKKLGIPKLGCGYDGLDWSIVRRMLEKIFGSIELSIVVCAFNPWKTKTSNSIPAYSRRFCSGTEQS